MIHETFSVTASELMNGEECTFIREEGFLSEAYINIKKDDEEGYVMFVNEYSLGKQVTEIPFVIKTAEDAERLSKMFADIAKTMK